jgi:hypothetical protein
MDRPYIRTAPVAGTARALLLALAACAACAVSVVPAQAETSATVTPSISPNRLGVKAALTFTIHYATETPGASGVPAPVTKTIVRLPAGLDLDIPDLRSCSVSRLRARGARGCPAQSQIGHGRALIEVHAGTENITEDIALGAFLGPLREGQQTLNVVGQGYSPLDERFVFTGTVLFASAPYGEELAMAIPPIPSLHFEPDASLVTFSLTIGPQGRGSRDANGLLVPSTCPVGGFPFAAEFTYADGTTGSALATAACPS